MVTHRSNTRGLGLTGVLQACLRIAAVAAALGIPQIAPAQEAPQNSSPSDNTLQEVVVTGSRVARSTFTTPNPVTVLDSKDITNLGLVNVGDVLAELPQNSNFFSAANVGLGNFNVGAQLANLRGLNPFFGTRTLTLIDTERVVPTATGGGVDVTLIPSMLVARTEVVTGGASAVYGSDAVAGVVNIILDNKLNGFKGTADYGETKYGDGGTDHFSVGYGSDLGDRTHFILGAEYQDANAIGICSEVRSWCSSNDALVTNTGYAPTPAGATGPGSPAIPANGLPHYIIGPNAEQPFVSRTGVLVPCFNVGVCIPLAPGPAYGAVQLNSAGTAATPYNPGLYADGAGVFGFGQGAGATGVGAYDGTTLRPAVKRYTGLGRLDFKINDNLSSFFEFSYARSEAINPVANGAIGPSPLFSISPTGAIFIPLVPNFVSCLNPYLPGSLQCTAPTSTLGPGGPPVGYSLGYNMNGIDPARNATNNDTVRITGGLKGEISSTWSWDTYFEYGVNQNNQHLYNNAVSTFLGFALDAVANPANGQIVCAATLPGPNYNEAAAGCSPLNLFGANNASPAALAYAFRTLQEYSTLTEEVLSSNIGGDLFSGFGAGPIKSSFGLEMRRDSAEVSHDLQDQGSFYDDYFLSYGLDYAGLISVVEGYGEVTVPVLKDLPLAKYLEFDGAIRETRNENENLTAGAATDGEEVSHDIPSWKLSGIWDLTDWVRVRATRSRDVRAAGFRELYESYAVSSGGPFGSFTNPVTNQSQIVNALTGGNINLEPERADTTTVGFVLSPKSGPLERMQFSADWYDIILHDPITGPPFGLGVQNIVNECYAGQQAFCDRITFGTPGDWSTVTTINNTAVNLGSFETRGVDFEASYQLPLPDLNSHLNGNLKFRLLTSLLYNMTIDAGLGAPPIDYAGQSGPTAAFGGFNTSPRWQSNFFATYDNGPFSGTVQVRWIGPGTFETTTGFGGAPIAPGDPGYSPTSPNSISNNSVASATYLNLAASYEVNGHVSVFATINNVLNKDPPLAPGGNGYPTNPVYFDTYGMTWKLGVRVNF
jgi:iron complex outermembrane recepter protein